MKNVVALAGGVGGAKLALGLYHLTEGGASQPPLIGDLSIFGNTGDDLEMFGVRICPDLDTLLYTLSGIVNPATGWGIDGDTTATLEMLKRYGENAWFWLGDQDFATHLLRTQLLRSGQTLTEVTAHLRAGLGLSCQLLPMCNEDVRTLVQTDEAGEISFQEYFVHRRAQDTVKGLRFAGAEAANVTPEVIKALAFTDLIVLCPSNPYLSIWPILAVPGMREVLSGADVPIVVVSPIVGGMALKGPAAAIMQTFGGEKEASALGVAKLYAGWASGFVLDSQDAAQSAEIEALGFKTLITNTVMRTLEDKTRLAAEILEYFG